MDGAHSPASDSSVPLAPGVHAHAPGAPAPGSYPRAVDAADNHAPHGPAPAIESHSPAVVAPGPHASDVHNPGALGPQASDTNAPGAPVLPLDPHPPTPTSYEAATPNSTSPAAGSTPAAPGPGGHPTPTHHPA
ncbi:hypothetical protein N7U49_22150 [Streptomyces sp. AD2-2]|nr:hypothetical protein N7U49_22150 [Streptomyces sp. AD2-2]